MLGPKKSSLVVNADSFYKHESLPLHRNHQISEIKNCFFSRNNEIKLNAWISGPPGSGKTLCIKYLLNKEVRSLGFVPIYINCRERFTFLSIIEKILDKVKPLRSQSRIRGQQINILKKTLSNKKTVIALDEIDVLPDRDASDLLHHLTSIQNIVLICISTSTQLLKRLPENDQSRFSPRYVFFSKYNNHEIMEIIKSVAKKCLRQGVWSNNLIENIAKKSKGDARRGIALLKHSVLRAIENKSDMIRLEHLEKDVFNEQESRINKYINKLNSHQKTLFKIVQTKTSIHSNHLEEIYRKTCNQKGLKPISSRTINKYLNTLCQHKFLCREHGAGTPGWIYSVLKSDDYSYEIIKYKL